MKAFGRRWIAAVTGSVFLLGTVPAPVAAQTRAPAAAPRTVIDHFKEKRVALVIGNGAYTKEPLVNPANDARLVAATLRQLGFEVLDFKDLGVKELRRVTREFAQRLAREDGVGIFYYAGHGVEINGRNYLLPVDIEVSDEEQIKDDSMDLEESLMDRLEKSKKRVNLIILDACRDNPFRRGKRGVGGGLAQMSAPRGTLIAYATQPGRKAEDGPTGTNSVYTSTLAQHMNSEGLEVERVLTDVAYAVAASTNQRQIPWKSGQLLSDFYFKPVDPRVEQERRQRSEDARIQEELKKLEERQKVQLALDAERTKKLEQDLAALAERERRLQQELQLERQAREAAERASQQARSRVDLALAEDQQKRAQQQAEQERLARESAERERAAREAAGRERQAEQQRAADAAARAALEQQRLAREKAVADQLARERAERDRLAEQAAEKARQAGEAERRAALERVRQEQERSALAAAERERLAQQVAERERVARERAETERLARETAEQQRLARDRQEKEALAREAAERERLARAAADRDRLAARPAEAPRNPPPSAGAPAVVAQQASAQQQLQDLARERDRMLSDAWKQGQMALLGSAPAAAAAIAEPVAAGQDNTYFARGVKLPADIAVRAPGPDVPAQCAAFGGAWGNGRWDDTRTGEIWVEEVGADCSVRAVYAYGGISVDNTRPGFVRARGRVRDGVLALQWTSEAGTRVSVELRPDRGRLEGAWTNGRTQARATFTRIDADPRRQSPAFANESMVDEGASYTTTISKLNFDRPLPRAIPGIPVLTTMELRALLQREPRVVLIDAFRGESHQSLPNSVWIPEIGEGWLGAGELWRIDQALKAATDHDYERPIVIFERSVKKGWNGYHALLRTVGAGYHNIYWYRGGIDAWFDAGLPVARSTPVQIAAN